MKYEFDLLVIGSGSAGFSAAQAAKGSGRKIGIVESDRLGGECPNWACVPTKTLLKSARLYREILRAEEFGVTVNDVRLDFGAVMRRRSDLVGSLGGERIEKIADTMGFHLLRGAATFLDEHTVQVGERQHTAQAFVIATGAGTFVPPIPGLDAVSWMGFRDAVMLNEAPESLLIIGGGPVGCEFATFFSAVGTRVTMLHGLDRLLSREEPEASEVIEDALKTMGVEVITGAEVIRVDRNGERVKAKVRVGKEIKTFEAMSLLLATGKQANTAGLCCQAAGVKLSPRGEVMVNLELKTTAKNIWAAGDVNGGLQFTHTSHYEGAIAGHNVFASKETRRVDERVVPRVTFTDPECASVGMTEAEVREKYDGVLVGFFEFSGLGRAYIEGAQTGFVKVVGDPKTGRLLGGHCVGERAGEVVHELAIALQLKARVTDLAETIHAYPTYSEAVTAAASVSEVK